MKIAYILLFGLFACHPRIYFYDVPARDLGLTDSCTVSWSTSGSTYLTVHDTTMPYTSGPGVPPVVLLVSRDGRTDTMPLRGADTLRLPEEGRLSIRNMADGDSTPRFRYMKLVAHKYNKDSTRETQVLFFRAEAVGSVGFIANPSGDSLVAEGDYSAQRWGTLYRILAVSNDMGRGDTAVLSRDLVVSHSGISVVLHPGDAPSFVFRDTPIDGWWSIRSPIAADEKQGRKEPSILHIRIIVKHL